MKEVYTINIDEIYASLMNELLWIGYFCRVVGVCGRWVCFSVNRLDCFENIGGLSVGVGIFVGYVLDF